ncbi:hypothetical protein Taro_022437, partial [Colocasia esculenta]|nr:hypothetical protein [Colocasia esculenta]
FRCRPIGAHTSEYDTRVQTLFAKEVSTHPTTVSTQYPDSKAKRSTQDQSRSTLDSVPRIACLQNWDSRSTQDQSRSTLDSVPKTACLQNWDSRSTQDQSRSTLDLVPKTTSSQIWDSVSTPPPGQVDTLRKDCNLNWMFATCQPRAMEFENIEENLNNNNNTPSSSGSGNIVPEVGTSQQVRSTLPSSCVDTAPLPDLFKSWVQDKPLVFLRGFAPLQTLF